MLDLGPGRVPVPFTFCICTSGVFFIVVVVFLFSGLVDLELVWDFLLDNLVHSLCPLV